MAVETTNLTINPAEVTELTISTTETTVLTAAPATINVATINFGNSSPANIARSSSQGTALTASRSDHVHSAADLLLDGGNY